MKPHLRLPALIFALTLAIGLSMSTTAMVVFREMGSPVARESGWWRSFAWLSLLSLIVSTLGALITHRLARSWLTRTDDGTPMGATGPAPAFPGANAEDHGQTVLFLKALLDAIPTPVFYKDRTGRYMGCNRAFTEIMGVDAGTMRGKTVHDLWPGPLADVYHQADLDLMADPRHQVYDFKVRDKNGVIRPVIYAKDVFYDPQGRVAGIVGAFLDITERKQAEDALRARETDLRVTLESIGDGVIATDTAGRITRMNPVAERLTGTIFREACGRSLTEVFRIVNAQTRVPMENPVQKVLATGQIVGLANHTVLIGKDGQEHHIADSGAPIRADDGNVIGIVLVFRDVTHEYAMQAQLEKNQKIEIFGQLASGIAHDFNNMLAGVLGGAELLKRRIPTDEKSETYMTMILDSAQRAADLTRKLLLFARQKKPRRSRWTSIG